MLLLSNELNWMLKIFPASLYPSTVGLFHYVFVFDFILIHFCCLKLITASAWHVSLLDFCLFVCLLLLSLSMFMFNYPFYSRGLFIYSNIYLERFTFDLWSSLVPPVIFAPLFLLRIFVFEFVYIMWNAKEKKTLNGNFLKRITSIYNLCVQIERYRIHLTPMLEHKGRRIKIQMNGINE